MYAVLYHRYNALELYQQLNRKVKMQAEGACVGVYHNATALYMITSLATSYDEETTG